MNQSINEWVNERTNEEHTNEQTNEWINEWTSGWVNDWISEWMNGWMDEWMTCGYISEIQIINNWIGKSQIIYKKHSDQIFKFTKQGIHCQSVHSVVQSVRLLNKLYSL